MLTFQQHSSQHLFTNIQTKDTNSYNFSKDNHTQLPYGGSSPGKGTAFVPSEQVTSITSASL